jgi:Protein of unknown function (DUF4019)
MAIFLAALAGAHSQLAMAQGSVGAAATGRAIGDPTPPDAVSAATLASDHWLAVLDAGNFGDSWQGAAEVFKLGVSQADWISQLEDIHSKLGKATMREMKNAQFSTTLRGAPSTGEYVTISYLTKFANAPLATETLIVSKEADGEWRIAGYNIAKAPNP